VASNFTTMLCTWFRMVFRRERDVVAELQEDARWSVYTKLRASGRVVVPGPLET
jgi:hypothetical protein